MRAAVVFLALALSVLPASAFAAQPPAPQAEPATGRQDWVPPVLEQWRGWVLHGAQWASCPPQAGDPARRECLFPMRVAVKAGPDGAEFEMTVRAFSPVAAPLPSAPGLWPQGVTLDGREAAVLDASGTPQVRIEPGEHRIRGTLPWKRAPKALSMPPGVAMVELVLDGKAVARPKLDDRGLLEIARADEAAAPEESVAVKVFRLIKDGVPMTVTTAARIEVSGRTRTIVLDGLLPRDATPMSVSSPVPVGFGPDGKLLVQAGAGRHDVEVTSRLPGPATFFGPATAPFGTETWAFAQDAALRELRVKGLASIDPKTTDLPEAWKRFPAFTAQAGGTLSFEETRRGEASPRTDSLNFTRAFWLDFDGKGMTARDALTGTLRRGWSLSMLAPGQLGRVSAPGGDLPIVKLGGDGASGVELRDANLNLTAESRYPDPTAPVPATGWKADAASLTAEVNLPPGWRLLDAVGPDSVSGSWVGRWNLLNIFLTLFTALAAFKLRGVAAGAALLAYLAVAQHEPLAPVNIWLALLAALGIRTLFERKGVAEAWTRAARGARLLFWATLGVVAVASLPFVASQLRTGVYPQLELPSSAVPFASQDAAPVARRSAPAGAARMESAPVAPEPAMLKSRSSLEQDPSSLVQTGPGVPDWHWRQARLKWNGPVDAGQTFTLVLVGPGLSSALCFARVALLLAALWLVAGRGARGPKGAGAAVAAALVLALALPSLSLAQGAPPKELLDEFRDRLTRPADCFPDCAGLSRLSLKADAQALTLTLEAGAATRLALPLPVVGDGWRPSSATLDGAPATLLSRGEGLWALVPEGPHRIVLSGPLPPGASFTVSTPLPVRSARVDAPGFGVLGLGPDGDVEGGLTLTRKQEPGPGGEPAMTAVIPPFLEVERSLELGLSWEAGVTVRRLAGAGEPVVAKVPLLAGESVLSGDARVEGGFAVVALSAGQREARYRSRLEIAPKLELAAAEGSTWVEVWRLAASPVWDVSLSGAPVVTSLDASGRWTPTWRPWPGEKAVIAVTRPDPAPGESLTIDSARLAVSPGKRLDAASLTVNLRSALGGRHALTLPAGSEITAVSVGGRPAPWSSDKPGEVGLQLSPGAQNVLVSWRQPGGGGALAHAPSVGLGHAAANVSLAMDMPRDRWILWAGADTPMGPAVLFWSSVAAVAVAAFVLGFVPWTPLGRWQWLLLGLGLTQVDLGAAVFAVLWLLALGLRRKYRLGGGWFAFNAVQVGLVLLTLIGLGSLFEAIRTGLLGSPVMGITGNGSSEHHLAWYFDRVTGATPGASVFSVSLWWYRGVMLAWSLWLALSLLKWLRWGWESFSEGGAWRKAELKLPRRVPGDAPKAQPQAPVLHEGFDQAPEPEKKKEG